MPTTEPPAARRMLLVHAHPDDETIGTGATMARYAAEGAEVTLVTCTLGELGEIVVPQLAGLASDQGDQLGGYRMGELAAALTALGVTRHHYLGGPGRFRDSGMMGTPGNRAPRAFWRAASDPAVFAAAVRYAVEIVRSARPQVLVTYDPDGAYGHPDHIMAHRVATAAAQAAADPAYRSAPGEPWTVAKFYWTATPRSVVTREIADVTTAVHADEHILAKTAAMRAHATQLTVDGCVYALSNNLGRLISGVEYYRLAGGTAAGALDEDGRETDLFAGVA